MSVTTRLITRDDVPALVDLLCANREFLAPWEPLRTEEFFTVEYQDAAVAEALKQQDPSKRMVVEGHTDSQGSPATNQPLSLNRAAAVRDYLVTRGVASDKITAVGMAATRPIVDNNTAENRANNRRVEIVVQPSTTGN
jgi:ribosomal protein S18 acetylase RimI-like enzyme